MHLTSLIQSVVHNLEAWPALEQGKTLVGRGFLKFLEVFKQEVLQGYPTVLVSPSTKYPLPSYSEAELGDDFLALTGEDLEGFLRLANLVITVEAHRLAVHTTIMMANAGQPQSALPGKAKGKGKGKASGKVRKCF